MCFAKQGFIFVLILTPVALATNPDICFLVESSKTKTSSVTRTISIQQKQACSTLDKKKFVNTSRQNILKKMLQGDVNADVEQFKNKVEECRISLESYGLSLAQLNTWEQRGYESELLRVSNRMELDVQYGDISASADEYRKYAQLTGKDSKNVDRYITKIKKEGFENQAQVKSYCDPAVDMRDKFGPVRNQDSVGLCYAYTASDLVSYKLGKKVSAMDIGLQYTDNTLGKVRRFLGASQADLESGTSGGAIKASLKKGFCLEENLRSDDVEFSHVDTKIRQTEHLREAYERFGTFCGRDFETMQSVFKNINYKQFIEILESSNNVDYFRNLSDKSCQPRIQKDFELKKLGYVFTQSGAKKLVSQVHEQISKKNPVSIGISSKFLFNSKARGYPATHEVLVVGRRYNEKSNQCEFLIRNSWGRSCASISKEYECHEGNYWIPEKIIGGNIKDATYIK